MIAYECQCVVVPEEEANMVSKMLTVRVAQSVQW